MHTLRPEPHGTAADYTNLEANRTDLERYLLPVDVTIAADRLDQLRG